MLSAADKIYIEQNRHVAPEQLAKDTNRLAKDVKAFLEELPSLNPTEERHNRTRKTMMPVEKKTRLHKQMGGAVPGVTIMTEGVSMQLDKVDNSQPDEKPYIFKIKQ